MLSGANKHHWQGLIGATWLHVGLCIFHCHEMITQHWPKGPRELSEVIQKSQFFNQPVPRESGPHRWAPRGGPILETWR